MARVHSVIFVLEASPAATPVNVSAASALVVNVAAASAATTIPKAVRRT